MNIVASWPAPSRVLPEIYPARIIRLIIISYEEVLGDAGFQAVWAKAGLQERNPSDASFPFDTPARLGQSVEEIYGAQTGSGLCLRAGRAALRHGVREFSSILGLTDRGFRLLPPAQKILRGMDLLAWLMNHYSDQRVRVEKTDAHLLLINERCSQCASRASDQPCCHFTIGVLQEGLAWASGGKQYPVEEIACRARGDATCTFRILRTPL
jgi:predicted hydrocarbon binding protein